jgi:hypothetical protein
MDASESPTCGKGLAENSLLPASLGRLIGAMAENLKIHMTALDLNNPNSRAEYDAYQRLVTELQQIAAQLDATAHQMAGYRNLPMGRHDEKAMQQPKVQEIFEAFVKQKRELLSLLEQTAERDDQILEMMRTYSQ